MATLPVQLQRMSTGRRAVLDVSFPPFPPLPEVLFRRYSIEERALIEDQWNKTTSQWLNSLAGEIRSITTPVRTNPEN